MTIDLIALINASRSLRPHTKRGYANAVRQWLDFAGTDPAGWTPVQAQAFYDHLVASGLGIATVNNMTIGGLTFVFKRAQQLYGIPNPIGAIDRYRATEGKARRALTAPQARAILDACSGKTLMDLRDRAIFTVGLYTGMRRMSLTTIDLAKVVDHGPYVTLHVLIKGGRWYDVPLDARAWKLTEPYRKALKATAGPMFVGLRPHISATQPVNAYAPTDRLTEDGLLRALGRRATVAGVKKFSPHVLRHTFITWCRGEPARVETQFIGTVTAHEDRARDRSYAMIEHYTDKAALAKDAARRCYEAITARLEGE